MALTSSTMLNRLDERERVWKWSYFTIGRSPVASVRAVSIEQQGVIFHEFWMKKEGKRMVKTVPILKRFPECKQGSSTYTFFCLWYSCRDPAAFSHPSTSVATYLSSLTVLLLPCLQSISSQVRVNLWRWKSDGITLPLHTFQPFLLTSTRIYPLLYHGHQSSACGTASSPFWPHLSPASPSSLCCSLTLLPSVSGTWFAYCSKHGHETWELVRKAEPQASPQTCWIRICILTRAPQDLSAY